MNTTKVAFLRHREVFVVKRPNFSRTVSCQVIFKSRTAHPWITLAAQHQSTVPNGDATALLGGDVDSLKLNELTTEHVHHFIRRDSHELFCAPLSPASAISKRMTLIASSSFNCTGPPWPLQVKPIGLPQFNRQAFSTVEVWSGPASINNRFYFCRLHR